jgi:cytochrome c biogenesis protein CcdA
MLVGLAMLFNKQWQYIAVELGLSNRSHEALHDNTQKNSALSDIFVGIVLGPVFTSCSPTYFFIVGTVIPQDLATGIINLIVYILGLTISLLLVSFAGQKLLSKLQVYSRPDSKVRQVVAILFIVTGFLIASGLIKDLEAYLIQSSGVDFLYLESKLQEMIPSNSNF